MKIDPSKVRRVLVITLTAIGDTVLGTAALQNLRRYLPSAHFTICANYSMLPVLEADPLWDEVKPYNRRDPKLPYYGPLGHLRAIREFRAGNYDLIIDLRSTLIPLFMNCRYRPLWGWRELFLPKKLHEAERNLQAMASLGVPIWSRAMRFFIPQDLRQKVEGERSDWDKLILINPGGRQAKRWPAGGFAEVAQRLSAQGWTIGAIGYDPQEQEAVRQILRDLPGPVADFSGPFSLLHNAARIGAARLFLTDDSGPLHIASALGTPTVALFGPSDPYRFGPWGTVHEIVGAGNDPDRPATLGPEGSPTEGDIRAISPHRVFAAVKRVLARSERASERQAPSEQTAIPQIEGAATGQGESLK